MKYKKYVKQEFFVFNFLHNFVKREQNNTIISIHIQFTNLFSFAMAVEHPRIKST